MEILQTIALDFGRDTLPITVFAKQGDSESRFINVIPLNCGLSYTLENDITARLQLTKPDGYCVLNDAVINDNIIKIELTAQILAVSGTAIAEIGLYQDTALLTSQVFYICIKQSAYSFETVESSAEYNSLTTALGTVNAAAENLTTANERAEQLVTAVNGSAQAVTDIQTDISEIESKMSTLLYEMVELNENDKNTGFGYVTNNGSINSASTSLTGFIELNKGAEIILNDDTYSYRVAKFDENKDFVSVTNFNHSTVITEKAYYRIGNINGQNMRPDPFNELLTIRNLVYTIDASDIGMSGFNSLADFLKKSNVTATEKYVVDIGGTGDYTSLTACLKALENNTNPKVIEILSGTYDIFSEMGGAEFAQAVTSTDTWRGVCPVVPDNTAIIGRGEVILNYLPDDEQTNQYAGELISVLNISGNVKIESLKLYGKNCRYVIHDETSSKAEFRNSTHKYKNVKCYRLQSTYGNGQAFGCGYDTGLTYEFENCYFNSQNGGAGLSMHNANDNGSNNITFKNCQFISSGNAALSFYNSGTTQLYNAVNISGCYLNRMLSLSINGNLEATDRINAYQLFVNNCNNFEIYTRPNLTNILTPIVCNAIGS